MPSCVEFDSKVNGSQPSNGEFLEKNINKIYRGNAVNMLKRKISNDCVDLSFWSPPYFVGKVYEQHMTFEGWQELIQNVIKEHQRIIKPGGFMVVNIGDILCFQDPQIPRFQADNIKNKKNTVTRTDILRVKRKNPDLGRHDLAKLMGCSEQTIQRRLEHNNVRGGKSSTSTRIMLTSCMVTEWAKTAGMYLYDRRIWHKDPSWMNSRWHSISYRAVDEFEHILVFWKPGITVYDRDRLTGSEWSEWGSRGVWSIPSVRKNYRHEAEFPEELARRVIRLFSGVGGLVIDPFVGTGTTTRMAKLEGRKWIGIDADSNFVNIARRRTNATR